MRMHVIENGVVVNTIEIAEDKIPAFEHLTLVEATAGDIGDSFDGKEFSKPQQREKKASALEILAALDEQKVSALLEIINKQASENLAGK